MRKGLILQNGRIYTMDPQRPAAEAVVLRGTRIAYVGSTAEMRVWTGHGGWEVIDLQGRTVLPGLTDAHVHLSAYAVARTRVNLAGVHTLEEGLQRVAQWVERTPKGCWIVGQGWNHNLWGGRWPTRWDLDAVAPEHPVALERADGHSLWVNSLALQVARVSSETEAPEGGEIVRGEEGQPTGILKEKAAELVLRWIGKPDAAERQRLLLEAFAEAHAYGITGVHAPEEAEAFNDYQALYARRSLRLRVLAHLPQNRLDEAIALGIRSGFGDERLRVGGLKIFSDGSLGSKTASLLEDYEDEPGYRGLPTMSVRELDQLVGRAARAGIAVAVHAIGDRAVRLVLDTIARAQREAVRPALPHRIEHVQLIHPQDIPRLAELGVVASMQPIHCTSDMPVAQRLWGDRCRYAYAWRSLLDTGAVLAFGSDVPVETMDPWAGIHAAVTRQRADGTPPGGWYREERLTVQEAVRAYTQGPAFASGESHLKGSITEGKVADLVVIDRDIFRIPPQEILGTRVWMTILGGEVVYEGRD
ncbi:MAG: amidohydrolase [Chloroflexia bacterium]